MMVRMKEPLGITICLGIMAFWVSCIVWSPISVVPMLLGIVGGFAMSQIIVSLPRLD